MDEAKLIFDKAVDLPLEKRAAFLEQACNGNPQLRERVRSLSAAFDDATTGRFVSPVRPVAAATRDAGARNFSGTARFAVQRQLGSGAFGTVYQVWDREQQVSLAAKVLHDHDPDVLLRFKREFRMAVELRHENLVRLHELFSEAAHWFFTMELIEGENFLEHVRPEGTVCRMDRLRAALAQLARGIQALHAGKRLHRDLKPANVLVTGSDRVVLLDFGLARDLDVAGTQSMTLGGTPAYMSPEQALQMPLTAASDWYALGVILFQALTGKLPNPAFSLERFRVPLQQDTRLAELNNAPADLRDLCERLLMTDPALRPSAEEIAAVLDASPRVSAADNGEATPAHGEFFVGREDQIQALEESFHQTQEGKLRVVLVEGASGIGKTAMVRHFIRTQLARHAGLLVLRGRCYEFESVPYKGLDALVDELTQYLSKLSESQVNALLPREAFLLPRLFPVLGNVSAIRNAPARSAIVPDEQELRQRTFSALRELLGRLSDRKAVVIWIDDLQWGDRDSSTFLAELCAPPEQPPLLLILTYRSEDVSLNPTLQYFHKILSAQKTLGHWRQIALDKLTREESSILVGELLADRRAIAGEIQSRILKEADGHPLFLQQLAYGISSQVDLSLESASDFELKTVLQRRVADLPGFAREVLEFSSIAAQPLSAQLLFDAAANSPADDDGDKSEALNMLVRERLLRISSTDQNRRFEPYHDQIRSAVAELLSADDRRGRHARLAQVLSTQAQVEPQVLVKHFQEAGDLGAAYDAAVKAAAAAEQQLAFDRAARFYEVALKTTPPQDSIRFLYRKLGETLGKAGRGQDAAHAYLQAATLDEERSFELRQLAANQLMGSGHVDEALALIHSLARECGLRTVKSPLEAVMRMIYGRIRTRLLFLRGIPRLSDKTPSRRDAQRLGLLHTAAIELTMADPVQSTYFQVEYIREAVKHGDATQLAAAFAMEASIRVTNKYSAAAFMLLDAGEDIAKQSGNPNAVGFNYLCRSYVDYLLGRISDGIAHSERAVTFLREQCTGTAWELTASYLFLFWFSCWSGKVLRVRELLPQLVKEGAAKGDVNVEVSLRLLTYTHYAYLSANEPQECLRELQLGLARWSNQGFHLQHYGALFGTVETYLYMGEYRRAREELLKVWGPMSRSLILRWQILTIMALFLRGRVALACWLDERGNAGLKREIERCAKRLKRIQSAWGSPMSNVLYAGLAAGQGLRSEAVERLKEAYEALDQIELHGYASAARHIAGVLREDERGRELIEQASGFLESQDVRDQNSFLRMLIPGRWT